MFTELTETKWGRILIPAIVFQSVSIGGGFATGRETVTYIAKFGALGTVSLLTYFVALSISGVLIYEFSRKFDLYDYKSLMKNLIGRFWFLFEIVYVILAIVVIAAIASAGGNLMNTIFSIPVFIANTILISIVVLVLYFGPQVIERFSVSGSIIIFASFILLFSYVLGTQGGHALEVLENWNTSYVNNANITAAIASALIYAGYSLVGFIPALFFVERIESRSEAIFSGIMSAFLLTVPATLAYLSLLTYYPNESVLGAPVPWLEVLDSASILLLFLYGLAIVWTLLESGVGYIHSITDRIDEDIKTSSYRQFGNMDGLSSLQRGSLGLLILLSALGLSQVGIIALVSEAYFILAVLFTAVLILPLLTIGLYRLSNPSWRRQFWTIDEQENPEAKD